MARELPWITVVANTDVATSPTWPYVIILPVPTSPNRGQATLRDELSGSHKAWLIPRDTSKLANV